MEEKYSLGFSSGDMLVVIVKNPSVGGILFLILF